MTMAQRPKITIPEFLDRMPSPQVQQATRRLMDVAEENGGFIYRGETGISLRCRVPGWHLPLSVAWLFPPDSGGFHTAHNFSFGAGTGGRSYDDVPAYIRRVLDDWAASFANFPDSTPASSAGLDAWSIGHDTAVHHIDELAERLARVLRKLRELNPPAA